MVTTQLTQAPRLTVRFDAFCRHLELQASAKANNGGDDSLIV
jgi:hypothetical protein